MRATTRRGFAMLIAAVTVTGLGIGPIAAQTVVPERLMPPPRVETIPVAPGPAYHWVPGHWVWSYLSGWFWNRGHYVLREVPPMPAAVIETPPPMPQPGMYWVRGHYVWGRLGWVWRPGLWVH